MYRGTTPTHQFTFPDTPESYSAIKITYSQDESIIFEKNKNDLTFEGNIGSVTLTQEETLLFNHDKKVGIQVRVLTSLGSALATPIEYLSVWKVLNTEVLTAEG